MRKMSFFLICTILILITPLKNCPKAFPFEAFFGSISDNTELNWYYGKITKNQPPEGPKESISFLNENSAYFLGDTSNKELYLTFDEGYENGYTSSILDTLKELNVPAAFFVVKPYIISEPDLVLRMKEEGHLVCNHSSHHPSMASITNISSFNNEILDVEDAYKSLTGDDMPKYFRPPMGKYSVSSLERTKSLGYKTIFWSFAYKDWVVNSQPGKSDAINKIIKSAHPGGIILLHAVSKTNSEILKEVLIQLINDGYEFKSLDSLPS